jgi:glycine/D-amino acid oxidase-like deaminating enzyme
MSVHKEKLFEVPIWDNQKDWVSPPPLKGNVKCDVCVVGLGGSGLVAINELAKLGFSVVGIDALDVGAGAAGRNGGLILAGTADFYHDSVAKIGRSQALELYQQTLLELDA